MTLGIDSATLKKSAKTFFTPELAQRGFALDSRGFKYFRRMGDIYHIVLPKLVGTRRTIQILLMPWVPELRFPDDKSPGAIADGISDVARINLSPTGTEFLGGTIWPVLTEEERQASFANILRALDAYGIPWFDRITTREALVSVIHPTADLHGGLAGRILGKSAKLTSGN